MGSEMCIRDRLEHVHEYFRMNPEFTRGSAAWVERDQGPRDVKEWRDAPCLRDYNGANGGRVFRYFAPAVFEQELAKFGVERETCNERQAVEALRRTSLRLNRHGEWGAGQLTAYAGPQCFPQVKCLRSEREKRRGAAAAERCDCGNCRRYRGPAWCRWKAGDRVQSVLSLIHIS